MRDDTADGVISKEKVMIFEEIRKIIDEDEDQDRGTPAMTGRGDESIPLRPTFGIWEWRRSVIPERRWPSMNLGNKAWR